MIHNEKMRHSPSSITDSLDSGKTDVLPDYCRKLTVRDSNGTLRELIFPKSLDLDRPKRARTTFSTDQLNQLEQIFVKNQYLVGRERSELAEELQLSETQVKVWFQNRRTKHKRDQVKQTEDDKQKAETTANTNLMRIFKASEFNSSTNRSSPLALTSFPSPPATNTSTPPTPSCLTTPSRFFPDFSSHPMGGPLSSASVTSPGLIGGHPLAACYTSPAAAFAAGFCLPHGGHPLMNAANPACMMAIQHQFVSQFVPNML